MAGTRQKKIYDQTTVMQQLDTVIAGMDEDRRQKYLEWLDVQADYLVRELKFDSKRLLNYERRDLILLNFGFNVGSELGGMHWGVVVEHKNRKGSNTIVVVPLSSLDDEETEESLHSSEVYLGVIQGINDRKVKACVGQIKAISKVRLYKPKNKHQNRIRISTDQMDKIDEKVKQLFRIK
ncbi:type II toxin-antitoxin system PemK/MazF family toxin [Peribacillus butanolivorans]|uniref:type II toxin-antitoxin system PemK/MazF family toxin n=2 Tax=Streptomyces TaxID=1883 RepID=UPI003714D27A